jgi:hypothetical protein
MSKEYLPDIEKRILLSAIGHEMRLVKENNFTDLIPVVKNLDYKFMYDRLFKQIEKNAYQQGKKDKEKELIEHNVFVSNVPIEDIVLDARKDEREQIVAELEKAKSYYRNLYHEHSSSLDEKRAFGIKKALEIVRGETNENEI